MKHKIQLFRKKSLHAAAFFSMVIMAIVPAAIISWILVSSSFHNHINNKIKELQFQTLAVIDELEDKDYLSDTNQPVLTAELNQLARVYRGRIILVNQEYRIVRDTYRMAEGKFNISENVINGFGGNGSFRYDEEEGYLELIFPMTGKDGKILGVLVLTSSTEFQDALLEQLRELRLVTLLISLIIAVAVSVLWSADLVRPLKKIAKAIDSTSQDFLGNDIEVNDCRETERIAQAYNRTLGKLRQLDESRQQFVSNVSHELKTPITSIRVLADSLTGQDNVPIEMYREFMTDISGEIERESQIIDDLLTLVRMDKTNAGLNIATVNINEMVESILMRLRPLALQKNLDLTLESFRPVTADADEVKLNLAIMNLVENAIKYNVNNGWVRVTINADHQYFYIKVADSGIGIPEKDWDMIFERFFRVDKARSRATGGTGLGLAITKNVISLHHGEIRVHSVENEGTTFTVRIPRTYVTKEEGRS